MFYIRLSGVANLKINFKEENSATGRTLGKSPKELEKFSSEEWVGEQFREGLDGFNRQRIVYFTI